MNPQQSDNLVDTYALLERAGIAAGSCVVDCGAGVAAPFTLAAAELVGETGNVYALDVVKDVLAAIDQRAKAAGILNIQTVWTDLEIVGAAKRVPDGCADIVVISDTLFQSKQKDQMVGEAYRMLKNGGRLLIIDWKPAVPDVGPPAGQRIDARAAQSLGEAIGMQHVETFDAGEYHWALVLKK